VEHIRRVHREVSPDCGSPRVYRELEAGGIPCSLNTVAKVMKDAGLRARVQRKYRVVTTDSKHDLPIAPKLLQQNFQAKKPNAVWLTDITYVDIRAADHCADRNHHNVHQRMRYLPPSWIGEIRKVFF
jgi:transposase InsO family protein